MEPRSARSNFVGALICALSVVLLCLFLLWRDPLVFWNDDYQISILPVFADVARSWSEWHWPILSPYSWVCSNLAGEYQYGTFSLFVNASVVAIWKLFSGFAHQAAALSVVHLVVLALGGFALARGRNLSTALATMVGLVAALNGWIICWGASDWFGALGAFAWIPWAWWGCEKALGAGATKWKFLWPAPFVYLVATGGFPYTVLMLGLLIAWLTIKALAQNRNVWSPGPMLLGVALGFGLAAPALLALLAYVQGSAREAQPASAHWQWIVPPAALPGLILPSWTVKWANFSSRYVPHTGMELACGLVPPVALLLGLFGNSRDVFRRLRWELMLLAVVLIITMLPTAGVFRWSFRWLPLFHLVLAIGAAESLRSLGAIATPSRFRLSLAGLALVIAASTAIAIKVFDAGGKDSFPLTFIIIGIIILWAVAEYFVPRSAKFDSWLPTAVTLAVLVATYFCVPTNCGVPRYSFTEALINPAPLDPARLYLGVYPGPEVAYRTEAQPQPSGQIVRPGSTSMWAKLHFINGYSPIRPAGVATQFGSYIHGDFDPDKAKSLLTTEAGPDGLLAQLGVDGITISKEVEFNPEPANEWNSVTSTEEGRVFHRRGAPLARVRSVSSLQSYPDAAFTVATVTNIEESRNRVAADVEVPEGDKAALITFSRPYFEGYTASLGGTKVPVRSDRGLYPVVQLPARSRGRLILAYRPAWLIYGGSVAGACALVWLVGVIIAAQDRK